MAVTRFDLIVHGEDGTARTVVADQRDIAAFERAEKTGFPTAMDTMPIVAFRFLAWHAQRRTGVVATTVTRQDWEDRTVEVEVDEGVVADPGKPEAHEEGSSDSPS